MRYGFLVAPALASLALLLTACGDSWKTIEVENGLTEPVRVVVTLASAPSYPQAKSADLDVNAFKSFTFFDTGKSSAIWYGRLQAFSRDGALLSERQWRTVLGAPSVCKFRIEPGGKPDDSAACISTIESPGIR